MQNQPADPLIIAANLAAEKLVKDLTERSSKVLIKYEYYNADNDVKDFGISIPRKMTNHKPGVGWAARAVHTLADRVVFDGFAGDTFGVNDYWDDIRAASAINKAKNDAFIAGVAFLAVSDDPYSDVTRKVLVPFTALEATGVVDQTTGLLRRGLAVTRWTMQSELSRYSPCDYILFMPEFTAVYKDRELCDIYPNPTGRCLLHPITRRASADRPLGKSRLTNTARHIIQEVSRQKLREEIAEEFYSTPQRYINGLEENATKDANLDSALGKIWAINKDKDGEKPDIGQLAQMSIAQFSEAKKDKARDFCAETGLTLRNLGYETGNPSSPESLAAMSDDLLLEAQTSQEEMGEQIKQIAITLRMALDGNNVVPTGMRGLTPAWKPIFQVDIGAAGDAMFKIFESLPELRGTLTGYRILGISVREAEKLAASRVTAVNNSFMNNGGA